MCSFFIKNLLSESSQNFYQANGIHCVEKIAYKKRAEL